MQQIPLIASALEAKSLAAISEYPVSAQQVAELLRSDEGQFFDFKSVDIAPGKLTRTLSAFANADGGELYIGIDEISKGNVRCWRGFANAEEANGHVQALETLFPLGSQVQYSFLRADGETGLVLQVIVARSRDIKFASDGIAYLRRSAMNLPQTSPEQIERLKLNKGITSFENQTVGADAINVTNSEAVIEFILGVVPSAEPESWLRKQQLIQGEMPTVAAIVLFADEPQSLLPKRCGIKVYRYKTKAPAGSRETLAFDPLTVEGYAYRQVYSAVERTVEIVEAISKLGADSFESVSYPRETLHEIITNAVLHRDYSLADDVHIRIFDNRIEVESPGTLPAHITPKNILDERFSRNGTIVRLINKFPNPPNKDVGEGLNTAFNAMRKLKLKDPVIIEKVNSVLVVIKHERLASPEQIIIDYLRRNESVNNKTAREICHIDQDYVIKRIFGQLEDRDMIERIPGTARATTAYRLGKAAASVSSLDTGASSTS